MKTQIMAGMMLAALAVCTDAGATQLPTYAGLTTPTLTIKAAEKGPIANPGEAFFPERPQERLPCFVDLDENGEPQVHFGNHSGIDYPVGTVVRIVFSNGEIGTYTYANGKFYAGSDTVQPLPVAWMPPLTCDVEIHLAENLPH